MHSIVGGLQQRILRFPWPKQFMYTHSVHKNVCYAMYVCAKRLKTSAKAVCNTEVLIIAVLLKGHIIITWMLCQAINSGDDILCNAHSSHHIDWYNIIMPSQLLVYTPHIKSTSCLKCMLVHVLFRNFWRDKDERPFLSLPCNLHYHY